MMNLSKMLRVPALLLLMVLATSPVFSLVDAPKPPVEFKAEVAPTNSPMNAAKLTWYDNPNGERPTHYNIYMAYGKTDDMTQFKMIESVKYIANQREFHYLASNLSGDKFSFYLTASIIMSDGTVKESDRTPIAFVNFVENKDPYIKIVSEFPAYAKIDEEFIYKVKVETNVNCPLKFEMLKGPEGMTISDDGIIKWMPTKEGYYDGGFSVKANCDDPNKVLQTVQQFRIKVGEGDHNGDYVKITSKPIEKLAFGETFYYEINTESNVKCPVLYKWQIYSMDANGKLVAEGIENYIKWMPEHQGTYVITIQAYLECDNNIQDYQKFTLKVGEGDDEPGCSYIAGYVMRDDGTLVMSGKVLILSVVQNDNRESKTYHGSIKNGEFKVSVGEGAYRIRFEGEGIIPEWYEDAKELKEAKIIELKCNEIFELRAIVETAPQPKHYTVSGRVVSEADGTPVMSVIEFIPVNLKDKNENPKDGNWAFMTKTDSEGNYIITLSDNNTYIAHAIPHQDGYVAQYYNKVDDPWQADLIVPEDNITGIDFFLKASLVYQNGIGGKVTNAEDEILKSQIFAYLVNPADDKNVKYMQATFTNEEGNYSFKNMIPGEYVLLSVPADWKYVPGYFVMGDLVTQKWSEASRVGVGESSIAVQYDIQHRLRNNILGFTSIRGTIYNGSLTQKWNSSEQIQKGEPLSGAFVYVVNSNNEIAGDAFTDEIGSFVINNLEPGIYTLYADKVGYETVIQQIETDNSEKSDVGLSLEMNAGTTNVSDNELNGSEARVFPSPANSGIFIEFSAIPGNSEVSVFNAMGELQFTYSLQVNEGMNTKYLSVSTLSSGMYFARISNNGNSAVMQFSIVR
jgi:hypothetical protein